MTILSTPQVAAQEARAEVRNPHLPMMAGMACVKEALLGTSIWSVLSRTSGSPLKEASLVHVWDQTPVPTVNNYSCWKLSGDRRGGKGSRDITTAFSTSPQWHTHIFTRCLYPLDIAKQFPETGGGGSFGVVCSKKETLILTTLARCRNLETVEGDALLFGGQ